MTLKDTVSFTFTHIDAQGKPHITDLPAHGLPVSEELAEYLLAISGRLGDTQRELNAAQAHRLSIEVQLDRTLRQLDRAQKQNLNTLRDVYADGMYHIRDLIEAGERPSNSEVLALAVLYIGRHDTHRDGSPSDGHAAQ